MSEPDTARETRRRETQRQEITEHFLDALEQVVWRYRVLKPPAEHADLYADVVTAEVAQQLALARSALRANPLVFGER